MIPYDFSHRFLALTMDSQNRSPQSSRLAVHLSALSDTRRKSRLSFLRRRKVVEQISGRVGDYTSVGK
jgi:hypothetical protein